MKTNIIFIENNRFKDFKKGEVGYIDGYISQDGRPYLCCVVGERIVLASPHEVKVLTSK